MEKRDWEDGRYGFTSVDDGDLLACFIALTPEEAVMNPEQRDLSVRRRILTEQPNA